MGPVHRTGSNIHYPECHEINSTNSDGGNVRTPNSRNIMPCHWLLKALVKLRVTAVMISASQTQVWMFTHRSDEQPDNSAGKSVTRASFIPFAHVVYCP
jgi:hypothetical protein